MHVYIWKRYYVDILKGELNSTSTYAQLTKGKLLLHHIDTLAKINVKIDKCELPTFHWLPKLHKNPFKSRFISNASHCSTTFALTAVKNHVIKYSETAFSKSNVNYFLSIKTFPRSSKSCDCVTLRVLKYTPGSVKNRFDLEFFGSSEWTQSTRTLPKPPDYTSPYVGTPRDPEVDLHNERSQISYLSRRCSICKDIRGQKGMIQVLRSTSVDS